MIVLTVSYPLAALGPDPIGGAEVVPSLLDGELTCQGHTSLVVAPAGSTVSGHLIATPDADGPVTDEARRRAVESHRDAIARALDRFPVDLVHLHGVDFLDYLPETAAPILVTLHLPPDFYPPAALEVPGVQRVCVSWSQRRAFPAAARIDAVIPNGIQLGRFEPARRKRDFALALGRICPEKGFDVALRAAAAAGVPLLLAGQVYRYPEHERHFAEEIAPLLAAERRFLGPVAGARKRQLLAGARCLLVTSRVEETSSLVAMEALASGTPVIGFRRGALPELIEHGRTGFLIEREEELPEAIARAGELSAAACRSAAEERASSRQMTGRYLELYGELTARAAPRRRRPARLELDEICSDAELAALEPAWDELCDRSPRITPFQRPAWLLPWRRHLDPGGAPRALALHRGGQLVGLVPLELSWIAGAPTLRLLGAGVSDHLDAVLEPGVSIDLAARHLADTAGAWSELELEDVPEGSPLLELAVPGGSSAIAAGEPTTAAPLPLVRRPGNLDYYRRRLSRAGRVEWQTERTADPARLLDALFALHAARWAARGERGVLDHPAVQAFHRDVAGRFAASGRLRMTALELDGEPIACFYGFADHGRTCFYLSGFAPAAAALNPGTLALAAAIDRASDEGCIELDFLRGREPYKFEWGAVERPSWTRTIRAGGRARRSA